MNRGKPLFMNTYGKQRRKLSAWISPDTRKKAFESTASSESEVSIFEPAKPTAVRARRTSVASRRAVRPAKRKAMVCLKEDSDENSYISSPSLLATQQNKPARARRTSVASRRAVCPAKRQAVVCLKEDSDENSYISSPSLLATQQNKPARKSKLLPTSAGLLRQKAQQVLNTSKSEEDSTSAPKRRKITVRVKRNSDVYLRSVGHFITHRKGAAASKPKLPEACVVLDSSDDFEAGGGVSGSRRIPWPSRRRPPHMVSSAEKYVNDAGTTSTPTKPVLREISLNESADHSLAPCPRKPLFCSTPSAFPPDKQPRRKPLPINHESSNALSISVSHIGFLSTSQEDLDSPGQTFSPPYSAPLRELSSGEKHQSTLDEPQKESSGSELAKSHNNATETQNTSELSSQKLLSLVSAETEGSSHFVSAVDGLEWLVEALKENCLTQHCTVQLKRLDKLTVNLLHSQTAYSSSLDYSSSVHSRQTPEHPLSVEGSHTTEHSQSLAPSFHLVLSVNSNETNNYSQSVNICDSSKDASIVTDGQITNLSRSLDCKLSAAQMEKCLTKKCTVQLQTVAESQLIVTPQLKEFTHCRESGVASDGNAVNPEAKKSDGDTLNSDHSDDHIRSRKTSKRKMASDTPSVYNSRSDQTQSIDQGTEERAAALTATLKEKCLIEKVSVKVKRATLSKWKGTLQPENATHKSPTDVANSASDGQSVKTWLGNDHESEADRTANTDHHTRAVNAGKKKRGSTTSEDKISSDSEDILRNPHGILHKRKKASLAPKEKRRRSVSRDRSGTTRKACVSGLSVSRWKNKGNTSAHISQSRAAQRGGSKAMDWSINELLSTHHKQPKLQGTSVIFSTPMKANRLNLSSLLADLTPDTHTWSRLKAALSVHRKTKVLQTPRSLSSPMPGSAGGVGLPNVSQDLFATPLRTPLPKRFQSQLLRSASVIVCEDADLSDAEKVYAECGQQGALSWEECILPQRMKRCVKIGEGTFGEVFSTTNASGDTVALKVIPVEGSEKVNGEDQKSFGEILHEIIISKELSSLKEKQHNQTHGFIGLIDLHCVRGSYPPAFLDAWDAFDHQKGSENDRPDFFEKEQLFLILEFEFGGSDLENSNGTLSSLVVAKSILHQVTAALAVAEQELHFEHRDLHWGNVLVKTTKQKKGSFLLNGTTHSLDTKGVLVRIIDYSLSRLEIDGLTVSCDISEDEELFMGQGDYQFDIYRLMREENGNNWSNYQPHSNVLWLHYLCSKLLSMKYRGPGGRSTKDTREELTRFHDNLLQYGSAIDVLQNCPMFQ